jgi:predicted DNA-binding transcriptional regulator AlpA
VSQDVPDRLMTAEVVADRLGVSRRYVYEHRAEFPFTVQLPGNVVRFSLQGLEEYISRHGRRAA